jgi:hypothetical protein
MGVPGLRIFDLFLGIARILERFEVRQTLLLPFLVPHIHGGAQIVYLLEGTESENE